MGRMRSRTCAGVCLREGEGGDLGGHGWDYGRCWVP